MVMEQRGCGAPVCVHTDEVQDETGDEEEKRTTDLQEIALLELRESIADLRTKEGWKDLQWAGNDLKSMKLEGVEMNADGYVTALDLSGRGMRGELPKSISNLSQLKWLELQKNLLAGKIAFDIGHT